MWNSIIESHFQKKLEQDLAGRDWFASGDIHIRSVGLLIDADNSVQKMASQAYRDKLESAGIKVIALWHLSKSEPQENVYTAKNINRGVPSGEAVHKFLSQEMDVVLVPNSEIPLHFEYILAMVKAKLRIGTIYASNRYLDLIIDVPQPVDTNFFFAEAEKVIKLLCNNTNSVD